MVDVRRLTPPETEDIVPPGYQSFPDAMDGTSKGTMAQAHEPATVPDSERARREAARVQKNRDQLKKAVKSAYEKIEAQRDKRKAANEVITAAASELQEKGFSKKIFSMVRKYMDLPEDDQRQFDMLFDLAREALDKPRQAGLFDEEKPAQAATG